jgi:hypothetical protein
MLKALIWKEWREQRQVAAAGIGMAVLLPAIVFAVAVSAAPDGRLGDIADMIPFLMAVMVWPLFAALAGATTNAEANTAGSLDFLMSRPVSRTKVWAIKVSIACTALMLIVGVSYGLGRLIDLSSSCCPAPSSTIVTPPPMPRWQLSFPFASDPVSNAAMSNDAVQVAALGFVSVSFAAAIFFSAFARRQVVTAICGMGASIAMTAGNLWAVSLFSATARRSGGSETLLAAVFLIATVTILGGALYVFRAGGSLAGAERHRAVSLAAGGIALVLLVGTVAGADLVTRIDADNVLVDTIVPGGHGVIVLARGSTFSGQRYGVAAAGQPVRLLTDRFAEWALPSPGGDRIFYATRRGPFGFRRAGCELRAASLDGSDDRRVLPGVPCSGRPAISPDGSRIAAIAGARLSIRSLETGAWLRQVSLQGTPASAPYSLTWIDETRILVRGRIALVSVDAGTGEIAELHAPADLRSLTVRSLSGARAVVFNNYREAGGDRNDATARGNSVATADGSAMINRISSEPTSRDALSVIELVSGRVTAFPRYCPGLRYLSLSPDGDRLYYPDCPNDAEPGGRLRVHDFGSGEDVVLAELDGRLDPLLPSPAGSRLLVRVRSREEGAARPSQRYFVIDVEDGVTRRLEQTLTWRVHAWLDEYRLVVLRGSRRTESIALLDVDTGEVEVIAGVGR